MYIAVKTVFGERAGVRGHGKDCHATVRGYGSSMNTDELFARASAVAEKAYAPYSHFQVGCALLTAQGNLFTGCNVENASYGLTICAERNAIFHAVAEEGPDLKIVELAVIALGQAFPPCGACRQVMAEFAGPEAVGWFLRDGKPVSMTMAELLPASFRL